MVKKGIVIFVILSILSFFAFIFTKSNEDELRIRILANSNSCIDIEEKEMVKEIVEQIIKEEKTFEVDVINKRLQMDLPSSFEKQIRVELVNSYYPAKSYQNKFIPSGSYKTLLITIGEGKGHNFWTLLYPEYYDIEFEENNEIEYRVFFLDVVKEIFTN